MKNFTRWVVILGIALTMISFSINAQTVVYNFTTAGATGQNGPTQAQVNTAYSSTTLNGLVTVTGGVQSFTAPASGTYIITTAGASGGSSFFSSGGSGAIISTTVNLTAGQVINIVVGQSGQSNGNSTTYYSGGSGGGGSFVYTGAVGGPGLLAAAGGGGGGLASPDNVVSTNVSNGNFLTYGDTIINEGGFISLGGANGNGGGFSNFGPGFCGGPGSGWFSDYDGTYGGDNPTLGGTRFTGGTPTGGGMPGGFGGGGASGENINFSSYDWAGGGGGYSGGGSGSNDGGSDGQAGGGGGSFASGPQTNVGLNDADGYVTISFSNIYCTVSGSPFCAGSTFRVPYNASGTFNVGNVFTAQLSDATGNFTSPANIGSIIQTGSDTITATLPANTPSGTGYRIRVVSSNQVYTGADNGGDIVINALPGIGAFSNQEGSVCPGTSVTLNGTGGVSYVWSNGISDGVPFIIDSTATYTVTGTDNNGCSATASIQQPVFTPPVVGTIPSPSVGVCTGSSVTLFGTGASQGYQWSGNISDGTPFIPSMTAYYYVTGTDNNGCTGTDSVLVIVHNYPVANVGPDISQCGGFVTIDAGNPDSVTYTYVWSDNETTKVIHASTSGYYSVTVTTPYGCSATSQKNIYIKPLPVVDLGNDTTQCGGAILLNAGNTGDLYSWNTSDNTQTITVNSSNTYSVTVTDPNSNCSAAGGINVTILPVPVSSLAPSVSQCGGAVTLTAGNAGFSYSWSDGTSQPSTTVSSSGTYIVTITDNSNGCSTISSSNVYINPLPVVSLGNDTTRCGGAITLNAGNTGDFYTWSTEDNTQTITVTVSGAYFVTVTDPNSGCSASSGIQVTILPLPTDSLVSDTSQCGGTIILNAGSLGFAYLWSNGSALPTTSVSSSGTYTVTVTNTFNGCAIISSVNVYINHVPVVNLGPDVIQCGGSVTLDAGNGPQSFSWSTGASTAIITADSSAIYYVTVTDLNSLCTAADSISITIDTLPVVNLGPDTTQCGGSITLNAGNFGSVYLWSDNSTNQILNVSATGIYRVSVTDGNGCTGAGSTSVTINPVPQVSVSLPANVCSTTPPFALSGGSPAGGVFFEADTVLVVFDPNQQGIGPHQITYVFTNVFGCVDSAIGSIFVRPQPGVTTSALPVLCTTSSEINLNQYFSPSGGVYTGVGVSANFFYPSLVPAGRDTVVDIYTDVFGCADTTAYPFIVNAPVHVDLLPSVADFTICQTQSITFTSNGADAYQFFVNGLSQGIPSANNTYTTTTLTNQSTVYVVGYNACSTDTSEPLVIDVITPPVVSAGNDTTIALGQTVQLHGTASGTGSLVYQWTPGNGLNFTNVTNPTYSGSDSITFSFKATDTYGCADSAQVSVYVYVPDNVQLPNVITPNGDGLNDVWKLNPKIDLDGSNLVIFDRWGQVVYQTENYANNWGGTYKSTGQLLPDGTYYYVLKVPAQNNHTYEGPINIISGSTK